MTKKSFVTDMVNPPERSQPIPRQQVLIRKGVILRDSYTGFQGQVVEYDGVVILEGKDDSGRRAFPFEPDRFLNANGQPVRISKTQAGLADSRPAHVASHGTVGLPSGKAQRVRPGQTGTTRRATAQAATAAGTQRPAGQHAANRGTNPVDEDLQPSYRISGPTRTSASGAIVSKVQQAKVARPNRIWVEGIHDADLLEKVWGDELRELAIVVEPMGGIDNLAELIREFRPNEHRRLGILVDHLIPRSKEQRLADSITVQHVLITGHPYVDVWAAVRPAVMGIAAWPEIPIGTPWKEGIAAALGYHDHRDVWRDALGNVRTIADLETPLVGAVEQLLDFLTPEFGA